MGKSPSEANIAKSQNSPENIELLSAQRQLYSDAKLSRTIRTTGSLLTAIPLPVIAVLWPNTQPVVSTIGAVWLAISLVLLLGIELVKIKTATCVLEQFDVTVFGIPWNKRVAGNKVACEVISDAARRDTKDKSILRDWYPTVADSLPHPLSALLCQRAAVVWDWRLRKRYGYLVASATVSLLLAAMLASVYLDYSLTQTLLIFILPMASAFAGGVVVAMSHLYGSRDAQDIQEGLDNDWMNALNDHQAFTFADCRQQQDARFHHRLQSLPVPDYWYRRSRRRYQADMVAAAKRMVGEFGQRSFNPEPGPILKT